MDDTTSIDGESSSLVTSVTSILGIKSQTLRFRPHKSTQKPHVILRRVQVSSSEGCSVYFSLFAQKRIEVKPGKEILLAIASPDERFKDQAMVLEGDIEESESEHDEEDPGVCPRCHGRTEREESAPPLQVSMPPKMRRAWNRNLEDTVPAPDTGSATRVSVGVQAAPSFSTASVQSQPQTSCASVQAQCSTAFACVQTSLPSSPMRVSSETQTFVAHATAEVQTKMQLSLSPVSRDTRERSLSPMELDSQCNSAPGSPIFSPTGVPAMIAVLDSSTNTPTSISSSLDVTDMEISPIESSASPLTPLPPYMMLPSPIKREDSDSIDFVKPDTLLDFRLPESICDAEKSGRSDNTSVGLSKVPRTSSGVAADGLARPKPQNTSVGVEEPKPLKRTISNPFVSAGFVSDFIGSERKRTPLNVHVSSTEPSTSREPTSPPCGAAAGVTSGGTKEKGPHVPNDASFSKSRLPCKPIPTEPRAARKKPPTVPRSMLALSATNPTSENASAAGGSPPPDPKSLAYLAPGSASNPLGIRPCSGLPTPRQTPISSNPTKKRVVLGSDWPLTKATSVNVGSASKSSLPPTNGSRLLGIEGYASPSPPSSPPPPPPPGNPPSSVSPPRREIPFSQMKDDDTPQTHSMGSKWKRICIQPPTQPEGPAIPKTPAALDGERTPRESKAPTEKTPDGKALVSRISPSVEKTVRKSTTPVEIPTKTTRLIDEPPLITPMKRKASEDASPITPTKRNSSHTTPIPVQLPVHHPLPPKPAQSQGCGSVRGVKRERATSPDPCDYERSKRPRQKFKWPTIKCLHSVALKGKSDIAIKMIAIAPDGVYAAVTCNRTTRIWNAQTRAELAQLAHGAAVVSVVWIEGSSGIITLQEDGVVSKWIRTGSNQWHWTKIVNAGKDKGAEEGSMCLAYGRDRVAVSLPQSGVKIWIWNKGTWQFQRSILRQNVTAIKFVHDGTALLGGTRDGVLWHSEVPNGTLRVYALMKDKIVDIDLNAGGTCALVTQTGGVARLVDLQADRRGQVTAVYGNAETETRPSGESGAAFVANGQGVLHGSSGGCVLVWDMKKGSLVYGLEHEEDDIIQAVAGFDGSSAKDGCIITGTKQGHLYWWSQPSQPESNKRTKTAA
ncbi:WD40 repeat-like protein [Armillaria gallica]|uniref:WD40 repeat-like protein n=1 Tax=Armillaria gallica TaxID=47427 RepID=A0A2H3D0E0_ARMGA|nr:WD40 repeat-like protein [Armillaria gallica]